MHSNTLKKRLTQITSYFSGVESTVNSVNNNSEIVSSSSEIALIDIDQNQVGTYNY